MWLDQIDQVLFKTYVILIIINILKAWNENLVVGKHNERYHQSQQKQQKQQSKQQHRQQQHFVKADVDNQNINHHHQ